MTTEILHGDCRELIAAMPDNSVDAIVTDPPYELGFMGKAWDSTGIAYDVGLWRECLRVIKPGGHLLAFGGSRTYHRLACAIEDAGWQIRDQIMWVYGSGFPKSLDVSKAIDKAAGAERKVVSSVFRGNNAGKQSGIVGKTVPRTDKITMPATEAAEAWDGWGTALKPAHEPIVMARKPLAGTVADNVQTWGTGAINIDGTRVETDDDFSNLAGRPIQKLATRRQDETDDEYRARVLESPGQQAALEKLKTLGRWPANFIHDGSDEVLALFPDAKGGTWNRTDGARHFNNNGDPTGYETGAKDTSNGSAARFFYCAKPSKAERNAGLDTFSERSAGETTDRKDGSAGLNSPRAGAGRSGGNRNHHPTVKPIALMRYLIRLVTPPNGTVLDPFAGSGTTLMAAIMEGHPAIGCELTAEYLPIIEARTKWAEEHKIITEPTLFDQ